MIYLDALVVKIRDGAHMAKRAARVQPTQTPLGNINPVAFEHRITTAAHAAHAMSVKRGQLQG